MTQDTETEGQMLRFQSGKYMKVSAISRRVRALQSGSKAMITVHPDQSMIDVALEEMRQGKLDIRFKNVPGTVEVQ